jgi:uncharacterized protein YlxW (UPF0749 family)
MGASLLDQVLAETLDPAYLQAAEARAERERAAAAAGEPPAPATRARRRRLTGQVLVAAVLALAGLMVGVTYHQASAGAQGRAQVREALVADIDREQGTVDALTGQLGTLRGAVDRTRDAALRATGDGQGALDELAAAEQAAAAVPVTGPGLRVTLADAPSGAAADPVGGRPTAPSGATVRDSDLQLVVNALWAAGAEAISIDGQRLGPTSTIRTAGEAILVDFQPVASPYQVNAVGDENGLSQRFLADPEVQALALVTQSYGLRFEFAKQGRLSLPAAPPPELHSARPLTTPATPAPATAVSPSAAPPGSTPATPAPTTPPPTNSAPRRTAGAPTTRPGG